MPQMAPISWLIMFIVFSISFIMFNMTNYYNFLPVLSFNTQGNIIQQNCMTWKW
uniref:ATP synthase complex subunit 8 n=1 Tax=Pipunculus sp. XL-2018 TaxID=2321082 RepID=A0A5H2PJ50_9MUSC|nr:ATP synthase F0 subunit 8 [Pipunculus sp. XL-2018]